MKTETVIVIACLVCLSVIVPLLVLWGRYAVYRKKVPSWEYWLDNGLLVKEDLNGRALGYKSFDREISGLETLFLRLFDLPHIYHSPCADIRIRYYDQDGHQVEVTEQEIRSYLAAERRAIRRREGRPERDEIFATIPRPCSYREVSILRLRPQPQNLREPSYAY